VGLVGTAISGPGSRAEKNGFPPLSASDAALLRLIERGVAAGAQDEDDDASAAQAARETGAAAVARAVKPPYGRDKGWLTQMLEDWLQSISPLLKGRYQAWPSPSHPVSPMSAPASPSLPGGSATTDEPSEAQAARDAGAAILARAARHPYGRRLFASAVVPSASTDTRMRESQIMRETAAQAARESAALKRPTLRAPRTVGRKAR
jgi:cell division septation protein DedD